MFRVRQVDAYSNARVKSYPSIDVVQVCNEPIFREPGWEPLRRLYDVPPKGEGNDPQRAAEVSRNRAKAAVRDIARCNRFDFFFTWTLDAAKISRYDPEEVLKKVMTFLKNASYRKGFRYVLVPELHKDGAIHFHGLCCLGDVRIQQATDPIQVGPCPRSVASLFPICWIGSLASPPVFPLMKTMSVPVTIW